MRISCPPHRFPCFYGIDFPSAEELIASKYSIEEIGKFLGVDSIGYLSLEGMLGSVKLAKSSYCTACWTGKYPLEIEKDSGKHILEKGCCAP
jgi:amidophosphoribosyltransferase